MVLDTAINITDPIILNASLALEFILFLWICVGNALVITAYIKYRSLQTIANYWILNLAIADFSMGISMLMRFLSSFFVAYITGWTMYIYCGVVTFTLNLSISMTLALLGSVTIDRFIAIYWPLRYSAQFTIKKAQRIVLIQWAIYGAFIAGVAIDWRSNHLDGSECNTHPWIIQANLPPAIFILALIIIILYIQIFRVIHKQSIKISTFQDTESNKSGMSFRGNLVIFKTALIVVGIFLICWLPCVIVIALVTYGEPNTLLNIPGEFLGLMAYANSGMNPIIYAWRLKEFHLAFCKLLRIKSKVAGFEEENSFTLRQENGEYSNTGQSKITGHM